MWKAEGGLRLSASDLMRFKSCAHATTLDLRKIEVGDIVPGADSEEAELLQRQGDAHELTFLESLKAEGRKVVEIPKDGVSLEESVRLTVDAMRSGADIIFQGAFLDGSWGGYSDFLERVEQPSELGNWSYEVSDTKLKRSPDPKHILQLVLYSDLVTKIQGVLPERAHLQLGDGTRFSVRLSEVGAYARHARGRFENFLATRPSTRPEPVAGCALCPWHGNCQAQWEADDSLALVAGLTRSQRAKLEDAGITSMTDLGGLDRPVPKLASEIQQRLVVQARLQSERRGGGPPSFALRDLEAGRGFDLLPEPDEGDLFYDIEGDPYYPDGLEYLHGVWFRDGGEWTFKTFWAHDRAAEGEAVAQLLAFFMDRLARFPRAHIYHYANYEIAALRRLTADHRLGEPAIDQLQRERRFVDLYKVVAGGLIASERGYSIKDLEAFYMAKRDSDVATAGASVVFYERWRENGNGELLAQIEDYNRTDCISTQLLRDWLVSMVRPAAMRWPNLASEVRGKADGRIEQEDGELAEHYARFAPLRERLGAEIGDLLFDLNYFHKREDKPKYWAIFDRLAQDSDQLHDDLDCIAGLEAVTPPVPVKQSTERTYRFPVQETKLRAGQRPCLKPASMPESVNLVSLDKDASTLVLRRGNRSGLLPDRLDLLPEKPRKNDPMRMAIAAVSDGLIEGNPAHQAIEHLLRRTMPAFRSGARHRGIVDSKGDLVDEVHNAIADMDRTSLAIQGPPGTGKTFVGAEAAARLLAAGKRVAVASHSHKAIENMLKAIAERTEAAGRRVDIVHKGGDDDGTGAASAHRFIRVVNDNDAPEITSFPVVGGTAWLFARFAAPAFDYLFVDEAGQVALANIVAMSRAANNIVLFGDPMQLPQPIQGIHPGQSGVSALDYVVGGSHVIAPEQGIFMPVSRRMHPGICAFISEAVYEGKLDCDDGAKRQSLTSTDGIPLFGATFRAVDHSGRSQACPEEVGAIRDTIGNLIGSTYRDRDGNERKLTADDIMVVAPYNAQVNALAEALPAIRVGTVDKFQGQEAPVCLVSMTTSSADELPRDIEFLFSLNRINVAVSRAQVLAMVFASPQLLDIPCRTVRQMTLVNTLCMLAERSEADSL